MNQRGISAKQLTQEAGLNSSAITEWKKGKSDPSLKSLEKVASYFNVTVDYLRTGKKIPSTSKAEDEIYPDDFSFALSGEVKELTDDQRKSVIAFVKLLKQQDDMEGK
jgi:transcriptional regulator with XRE-family HTH domain